MRDNSPKSFGAEWVLSDGNKIDELVREIGKGRDDNDWRPDPDTVEYIAKCLKRAVRANDDTAWLVEIDWGRLAWLSHFEDGFVVRWTNNANDALRFARKRDAASVAAVIGKGATAVEHAWMGPVRSDAYHGYQPPRPKNCAKPDDCGWHNVKTNPPSSLWTCFKCQRLSRAGEATLNEINQMKGTPK